MSSMSSFKGIADWDGKSRFSTFLKYSTRCLFCLSSVNNILPFVHFISASVLVNSCMMQYSDLESFCPTIACCTTTPFFSVKCFFFPLTNFLHCFVQIFYFWHFNLWVSIFLSFTNLNDSSPLYVIGSSSSIDFCLSTASSYHVFQCFPTIFYSCVWVQQAKSVCLYIC